MSTVATKWAWQADLSPSLKQVLLALAECHNRKTGQCNPKVETIATMVGKKKRATQYALRALEKMGYIKPIKRRRGSRQTSNQYALALDGVVFQSAKSSTLKRKQKCAKLHPESAENCTPHVEPESEPISTQPSNVVKFSSGGRC